MLITPTSVQMTDPPEKMKERKEKNGYRNGTTYTSLETQVKYDPKFKGLLKTPSEFDGVAVSPKANPVSGDSGCLAQEVMSGYVEKRGLMLPTPVASDNAHQDAEVDEKGRRIPKNGGTTHSQGLSDLAHHGLLPTPMAVDVTHKKRVQANKDSGVSFKSRENGDSRPNGLTDFLQFHGMLPTPNAGEAEHYRLQYTPGSQMGTSLSALGASGQLPTPSARDGKGKTNPGTVKEGSGCVYGETLPDTIGRLTQDSCPETDGQNFRLSPLFTEEMMGFPFGWTTLPFLSPSGEPSPSKPTETR